MRKRIATEGVRARRYRRLQLWRGVVLALAAGAVLAFGLMLVLFRSQPERITLNDWASTRAFSGKYSHAELRDAYKASHAAYKHYIRREQIAIDHSAIDKSFDRVRSEAELIAVLSDLVRLSEDPYARIWSKSENDHFFAVVTGKHVGVELGFNMDWRNNRWVVQFCPPESSAGRAGIMVGDELVSIGSDSVHVFGKGWQAGEKITAALNNGILGSAVDVVVRRGDEFISASVERIITGAVPGLEAQHPWNPLSVGAPMTNARVIRFITLYHPDVVSSLQAELEAANRAEVKGVVLNLTEGFGGEPETGIRVAAMFMEKGVICNRISVTASGALEMHTWEVKDGTVWLHTKGPFAVAADGTIDKVASSPEKSEKLDWACNLFKGQVVLSVGRDTRGAGEVIVAALKQDPARFVTVGTFWTGGRGIGQTHYEIGSGYVLRLSTSFWLQPDGKPIESVGIEPDRGVPPFADPTQFATMVLADRLQVLPLPVRPPQ